MTSRFPGPWRIAEFQNGFAVYDATDRELGFFYGRTDQSQPEHGTFLMIDDARQIAVDFAKLPEILKQTSDRIEVATSTKDEKLAKPETNRSPQREPETPQLPGADRLLPTGLPFIKAPTTVPNVVSFEPDGWMYTPLLRQRTAKKGTPQSTERHAPQANQFSLIIFLALAAAQFFIWLVIRGPALIEQISSWRPTCFLVSCETQAQPPREAQAQPEPKSQPKPQPQALLQPQAQPRPQAQPQIQPRSPPPRHPPSSRPHKLNGVMVGGEPQRRSPIECWRDRSIRGPCFD
jgi:hypothetical protein